MISLHSFLEDFKNGKTIGPSINKLVNKNPDNKLAQNIKLIYETLYDISLYEETIQKIQNFNYQEYAVEEQLIYLWLLTYLYCDATKLNSALIIKKKIVNLITSELPIELQILPLDVEIKISQSKGDLYSHEILFKEIILKTKNKTKRYYSYLRNYLFWLIQKGDQITLSQYIKEYRIFTEQENQIYQYEILELENAMQKIDLEAIPTYIQKLQKNQNFVSVKSAIEIAERYLLINTDDIHPVKNLQLYPYELSTLYLKRRQYTEALQVAHQLNHTIKDYLNGPNLFNFYLLRAELANGNINAAEYSLQQRESVKNISIFNDFFRFRIYHIKKEKKEAQFFFNRFYKNILKNNLENRLNFEISLSPELHPIDMIHYGQNCDKKIEQIVENSASFKTPNITIIGNSPQMKNIKKKIQLLSKNDIHILIVGETGTGKDVVAKTIHQARESNKPYLAINCASISDHLLLSELYGHLKGAFTGAHETHKGFFEEAEDGVVFLDEIGDITPTMQIALLRLLETNEYRPIGSNKTKQARCKIIMATNQDLNQLVKQGKFREDLRYRLERLTIEIPPLKERKEDIPLFMEYFLNELNPDLPRIDFDEKTKEHIKNLPWEGNIRELRNEMERIRLFYSDKSNLTINELSEKYKSYKPTIFQRNNLPSASSLSLNSKFKKIEALKKIFLNENKISKNDVMNIFNVSFNTATSYLEQLEKESFIQKINLKDEYRQYYKLK